MVDRRMWSGLAAALLALALPLGTPAGEREPLDTGKAQTCPRAGKQGPAALIEALYAAYPADGAREIDAEPTAVLRKYFDDRLTRLLEEEQGCRRREGMCRIDSMVMYRTQDPEIAALRVCAPRTSRAGTGVDVVFEDGGHLKRVSYRMKRARQGWRIADIRYTDGPSLLQLLSGKQE